MKSIYSFAAIAVVIIGGVAAYIYWQDSRFSPEPMQAQSQPSPPPKPEVRQVIEAPPVPPPLPTLANSDNFMLDELSGLVGNRALMRFFHTKRLIRSIVATIDNLPSRRAPMSVIPVKEAPGMFITAGSDSNLFISPKNAVRYKPYIKIAEAIDAKKLMAAYIRLYPLFQQAYEELGYPKKYFNDRLIQVLDNLLDAPDVNEPIKLVQTNVFYQFADRDIEERSIGQRILMRTGNSNEKLIKAKLHEIKQELMLHMHEERIGNA